MNKPAPGIAPHKQFAEILAALRSAKDQAPTQEICQSRLNELRKLCDELAEVTEPDGIGAWLTAPNKEFGGLKPIELIERGEMFRIWRMVFFLKSGTPA